MGVSRSPDNIFTAIVLQRTFPLEDIEFEPTEEGRQDFVATDALPGSKEKVEVMRQRLEAGLPLWHPGDFTIIHQPGSSSGLHTNERGAFDRRFVTLVQER